MRNYWANFLEAPALMVLPVNKEGSVFE